MPSTHDHILVTGGAGFIGSACCHRLIQSGTDVTCLDSMEHGSTDRSAKLRHLRAARSTATGDAETGELRVVESDIRDSESLDDILSDSVDAIIHLAALAGVRGSIDRPSMYIDINEGGTMSVLRAARRHGVDPVILAGSSSVYGDSGVEGPCHEGQAADAPTSPYAASKRSMELHARAFSHLHGLSVSVLRFFTVYGPRQRPDMAIRKFMERIHRGDPLPLYGDGSSCRCYTYIEDAVDAILQALDRTGEFRSFNVGGPETIRLDELVAALDRVTDRPVEVEYLPEQPGDVPATRADISRARRELSYTPSIRLDEGLRQMWEWLRRYRAESASGDLTVRSPEAA